MRRLLLALSASLAIGTPAVTARAGGGHGGGGHGGGCWGGGYHGGYCGYGHGYYGHGGYCGYYGHGYGGYYGHGCYYGGWYPSFYFGVGFGYPAYGYYGYPAYGYAYAPVAYPTYSYYVAQPYTSAPATVSGSAPTTTVRPAPAAQTLIYSKPAPAPVRQQPFTVASVKKPTVTPSAESSTGRTSTGKWVLDPNPYSYTPATALASAKTSSINTSGYLVTR